MQILRKLIRMWQHFPKTLMVLDLKILLLVTKELFLQNHIKNVLKCQDCSDLLYPGKVPLQLNFDETNQAGDESNTREEFIQSITRGGLIKPSDAFYILCSHAYMMFSYIINNDRKKRALLSTSNPRSVFVETSLQKCEDHKSTHSVIKTK